MELAELDGYDWIEAFGAAGDPEGSYIYESQGAHPVEGFGPGRRPYLRSDVARIIAAEEGQNDGDTWVLVAEMKDGNFLFLEAGCDYTGWDCQAGGTAWYAPSLAQLYMRAMNDEARSRLDDQLEGLNG